MSSEIRTTVRNKDSKFEISNTKILGTMVYTYFGFILCIPSESLAYSRPAPKISWKISKRINSYEIFSHARWIFAAFGVLQKNVHNFVHTKDMHMGTSVLDGQLKELSKDTQILKCWKCEDSKIMSQFEIEIWNSKFQTQNCPETHPTQNSSYGLVNQPEVMHIPYLASRSQV